MSRNLTLIFRDARPGVYSIERLFGTLAPFFQQKYTVVKVNLPHRPTTIQSILKNVIYANRNSRGIRHITGDAHYLAIFSGKRTVLTIHDCGCDNVMKGLKGLVYCWLWFRLPCLLAKKITVVSNSTKIQLEKIVGPLGDKVQVIENCVTLNRCERNRTFNFVKPRILQIGTGHHKNLDGLVQAVRGIECELRIVGKPATDLLLLLDEQNISYQVEYKVSDSRLAEIYEECDILFFASRHEGFGLPILEAQAVGMPVITSNVFSMPDVAGCGAILVDPESVCQIRDAIVKICKDFAFRNSLVEMGTKNIERFSVETVAKKYLEIYDELERSLL